MAASVCSSSLLSKLNHSAGLRVAKCQGSFSNLYDLNIQMKSRCSEASETRSSHVLGGSSRLKNRVCRVKSFHESNLPSESDTEVSCSFKESKNGISDDISTSDHEGSASEWMPQAISEKKLIPESYLKRAGVVDRLLKFADKISPRAKGLILLNLLTVLYGSNISVVKEAQDLMSPAGFSFGRFAVATIPFIPLLSSAWKNKQTRYIALELGVWAALGYFAQAEGIVSTPAGRASFISSFTVIEVPFIAGLFGAKIPLVTWLSAAAAITGVTLLESQGGDSSLYGDFCTFASALIFGIHIIRSEHHSKNLPGDMAIPMIGLQLFTISAIGGLWVGFDSISSIGSPAALLSSVQSADLSVMVKQALEFPWLPMLYTGLLSTAFCLWIEIVSLKDVSATEASMVYTLEPLYGAGFAWVLLGERWGVKGWIGAALILGGSLAMQIFGKTEDKEEGAGKVMAITETKKESTSLLALLAIVLLVTVAALPTSEGSVAEQALSCYSSLDLEALLNLLGACTVSAIEQELI